MISISCLAPLTSLKSSKSCHNLREAIKERWSPQNHKFPAEMRLKHSRKSSGRKGWGRVCKSELERNLCNSIQVDAKRSWCTGRRELRNAAPRRAALRVPIILAKQVATPCRALPASWQVCPGRLRSRMTFVTSFEENQNCFLISETH